MPPIVTERNCNSLRKMLMPSKLPTPKPHEPEQDKKSEEEESIRERKRTTTKRRKNVICKGHLKQTTTFSSVRTLNTYSTRDHLNCHLSNTTDCAKCKSAQYVGETGNSLRNRFYHHRPNIKIGLQNVFGGQKFQWQWPRTG